MTLYRIKSIIAAFLLIVSAVFLVFLLYKDGFRDILKNQRDFLIPGSEISVEKESITAAEMLGEAYFTYLDPEGRFSLEYPNTFAVKRYNEGDGAETIVFQSNDDTPETPAAEKEGFQIFITPFEEEGLTRERILEDIPDLLMEEITEIVIGGGAHALLFWSSNPVLGRTREVWLNDKGKYLYEITAYAHFDAELAKILSTWMFY